ncbi:hypothetical protein NLI96_g2432 [Meripilus lineatus]|uniref:Uncharacterized protein n=1 Tax=Meripilus lineatus TaxID=2056292 RepID=A0AAD5YLW8_9APHY|nr:hypothetical protein NLI96_g2432 [Physisporinus lineatus]
MRKTSYFLTFFAVAISLAFNVISVLRPDWLVYQSSVFGSRITIQYGLNRRCERSLIVLPAPDGGRMEYSDYKCRPFPTAKLDECDEDNKLFCVAWTTAGYFSQLSLGFAGVACLAIIFGVTTHSRRRRIWRAVAGLVWLHASFQAAAFAVITDLYVNSRFPTFEQARPGVGYVLNTLSWVFSVLISLGVFVTGLAASRGHRWAAGNRAYQPISG